MTTEELREFARRRRLRAYVFSFVALLVGACAGFVSGMLLGAHDQQEMDRKVLASYGVNIPAPEPLKKNPYPGVYPGGYTLYPNILPGGYTWPATEEKKNKVTPEVRKEATPEARKHAEPEKRN